MSWLATKYAWKCANPHVKGGTRLVFLALAMRVRKRRITTLPTSLNLLGRLTLMSHEQIRRCIDRLGEKDISEVRRVNRGKNAVYALPKMAGPLFVVEWEDEPVKMTEFSLPGRTRESGQDARFRSGEMTGFRRRMTDFSAITAGGVLLSGGTGTHNKLSATTGDGEDAAVEAFLDWFIREYPQHRNGVLFRVSSPSKTEDAVRELLRTHGRPFVERMALAMWADTAEPWLNLARNDRSPIALRQKATYLASIVHAEDAAADRPVVAGGAVWERCPHTPVCLSVSRCEAMQAIARKEAHG